MIRYTICPSSESLAREAEKRLNPAEANHARRLGSFRTGNRHAKARTCRCEKWGCITCMQRFVRNYYNRIRRENQR